ncbi:hypothetical protein FT643_21135 [Ketobacter sp. MCCC 1A13808]|uniref:hypothetical protein n=1 Tax=Ketobacter sp. MCCC 1A13808 TaxID=2602738 RepID=UPI0012EC3252|nr:hypothetical protein [Ketobacter sp. MCCC 1A13808]MVF14647.1 hypothetical protein [Ketobacter sp. MCCC 1A13808]
MQILTAPDLFHAEFQLLLDSMPAGTPLRQRFLLKHYRQHVDSLWQNNGEEVMAAWVVNSPGTRPQVWWKLVFPADIELPFERGVAGAWAKWPGMVPDGGVQQKTLMQYGLLDWVGRY